MSTVGINKEEVSSLFVVIIALSCDTEYVGGGHNVDRGAQNIVGTDILGIVTIYL